MDLKSRKILFVQEFLRLENEEIISRLENMMRKRKAEMHEENLKPMSMQQFNDEIDKALEDSENDRVIESSRLKSMVEKWD